jgi:hypothetical protein
VGGMALVLAIPFTTAIAALVAAQPHAAEAPDDDAEPRAPKRTKARPTPGPRPTRVQASTPSRQPRARPTRLD